MRIAFLGLGNMGAGMAHRILRSGHPLTVWNRSADKAAPLQAEGAAVADSPAAAARGADLIITSLMDDASVRGLYDEPRSASLRAIDPPVDLLAALRPGAIHLGTTTTSPACAEWLDGVHRAHGSRFVSGPVLGRPDAARAGKLVQFLAGDATAVATVEPICLSFAERIVHLGDHPGSANRQKLCMNFFIVAMIEAMSETYTLVDALGVSREFLAGFFQQSLAHPGLKGYAQRLNERNSDGQGGFALTAGRKDVGLILDAAQGAGCPADIASIVASKMDEAIASGLGPSDWSAIQEISRRRAGLT